MKILLVHNRYQKPGGEDIVFEAERAMLERGGHQVTSYERHNDEIENYPPWRRADLIRSTIWATDSSAAISRILQRVRPDIAHFHNTFPLISPAAYSACVSAGVPVIQTLSNYRFICPSATLQRGNQTCELCVGRSIAWPGIWHRCYRNSHLKSAIIAASSAFHRRAGSWDKNVDTFIALTDFARRKFIEGGLPEHKIVVKPNFVYPDPLPRTQDDGYVLFAGRLSQEKGVETLLRAWNSLPDVPLIIVGDGPLKPMVEVANEHLRQPVIDARGWLSRRKTISLMKRASFLVLPSECYEGFPVVIAEAFACGIPVIGSRLGGTSEIIEEGVSGLLFAPHDPTDLSSTVRRLWQDTLLRERLCQGARLQFEQNYTAEKNYQQLMTVFNQAVHSH